ncbi:carbohydrate ABC transporter substrate-binding protein (CUT1 family) [Micromonospora pisi]|uniref:Carbohydrate ABC transporter substrate-binding protein (CUT1 family) n=1 Tax=Micromonospora pisi TaxID=589240 RepID=A0A495JA94_9ACTN|nr:extracellular solute-binding protein [Micromonospora pisi]RKR85847.1 carbohydrate ABC transporter substrate-binding protein (CUT1 family) [Micromonospora pisi]
MPDQYSRRSFLAGVLTCGTLSAGAIYLLPGGRSLPTIELRLTTGRDPTGARDLLIAMWERANPRTKVRLDIVSSGTLDERVQMLSRAQHGQADIVNLDVIHIPEFARQKLITPIPLADSLELLDPIRRISQVSDDPDRFWAAPFNTDVGMLFSHRRGGGDPEQAPTLRDVLDTVTNQQFVGQLKPSAETSNEAFVINVLEHALSRDGDLLDENGAIEMDTPVNDHLERWQQALHPLRDAIAEQRVALGDDENDSMRIFADRGLTYMRNWPVKYRELQQLERPGANPNEIQLDALPTGILGGQSLALVANSPHEERAREFIAFMTGEPAQKVLAAHGLAPTRRGAYGDANLRALIPHLGKLRGAVGAARPRPIHTNYVAFSKAVRDHVYQLLYEKRELQPEFVTDLRAALA